MKKNLLYSTFSVLIFCLLFGCKDDTDPIVPEVPVPPTLGDIVATYTHQKLKLTVNGEAGSASASVTVVKEQDSTMTLQLGNIVPGVSVFSLPKSTFEVVSRSIYTCKLNGSAVDSLAGYEVEIAGSVTDTVLTAAVKLKEMGGVVTNVKSFYNKTYKGTMTIGIPELPDSVSMQRVYTSTATGRDTSSIKLQIQNVSFAGLKLGTITLDTLKVLKRGTIYAFKAKDRKLKLPQVGEVMLDVYGTMTGQEINLSLAVNATPLVANVVFGGKQVTESTDMSATITLASDAIFEQPVMKGSNYTFKVWSSTPAAKLLLTPKVELAQGAVVDSVVIDYGDGQPTTKINQETAIDFSKFSTTSRVKYYVAAEDVRKTSVKSLFMEKIGISGIYTMEDWAIDPTTGQPTPAGLTSSNALGDVISMYDIDLGGYFLMQKGSAGAAEIRTFRSVSPLQPTTLLPGITAGKLFNGAFALDMQNILKSTLFGEVYAGEPVTFKFSYKYTPGSKFYKTMVGDSIFKSQNIKYHYTEMMHNEKDSCLISAYLYEVSSLNETLNGTNIKTSPKVILKAVFSDAATTNSYVKKEIAFVPMNNKTYDSRKLYKLAVICSSSSRGDLFMGAPGSILTVEHLEVVPKTIPGKLNLK